MEIQKENLSTQYFINVNEKAASLRVELSSALILVGPLKLNEFFSCFQIH